MFGKCCLSEVHFCDGEESSSSGLKWENLAVDSGKPIEIPHVGFSMSSSGSNALCANVLGSGSSSKYPISASQESTKEAMGGFGKVGSLPPYKSTYGDITRMQNISGTISPSGASACSGEPIIGLGLGRQKEYGDSFPPSSTKISMSSIPIPSMPTKRSRASYQNMQNPCCQVEGCNIDLKSAKDYHRRHRICESHSKSPKVIVAGMERRFCQQCSRFHHLSEFDDKKRSCRRRLSDHNARRRRVQPESIQLSSAGLSSALYDQRPQNVLLNGLPISSTWGNGTTSMLRHALIRPSKAGGLEGTLCFSSDEVHNSISNLHMDSERLSSIQSSNPRVLDHCLHVPTTNSPIASDLLSAHSLLSSNSWSLNEGESTSMEDLVHGNYNPVMRHSDSEPHHLSLFQSNNIPAEQGPPVSLVHSVNLHNAGTSHQQEYQLFKAPYDSGGFYSSQRNL
ncbi:hypothetical protein Pfo_000145 [Paulownia fortunei]|nr:hypothetical protein Pfo_000145 [Paulownia fortunei]